MKKWIFPQDEHAEAKPWKDDIPIRLVVTFTPSSRGVAANFPRRPKASHSLFVMAKHGQLLKYSLDPDQSEFQNCKGQGLPQISLRTFQSEVFVQRKKLEITFFMEMLLLEE